MTRINEPVTGHEIEMPDNVVLASKTDLGGKITFANQAFVDISGFTLRELMGSPHNLVRHPHMPKEAFADLWRTIKTGRPWEGLVKNRAKNGDHYWVRANVTPVFEDGKHVGFISIRSKPTRAEIDIAEQLYAKIRAGQLRGYTVAEGHLVRTGLAGRVERFMNGLRSQAIMLIAVMTLFSIVAAVLDLGGAPYSTAAILGVGAVTGGLLGWRFIRTVMSSLHRLERYFEAMIKGDFAFELKSQTTPEFRKASALLSEMRAKLGYYVIEKDEAARRANEMLAAEMQAMAEALDDEARDTVGQVAAQAKRLTEAAVQLATISDRLRSKAREVAELVETTSGNVQTVAGATEQLEASSREISAQIGNTQRLAEAARGKADVASRRVAGLTEATARIGNVVTLIQDIAGQTRLLALNATIEAERAGAAGKGFAVVASEVKELAQQTDNGIDTVNGQAEAIGKTTRETAETVQEVARTIREIDATSAEVARAADEQRSATSEIMKSAATAAEHTRFVAENVRDMLQQAEATGETAKQVDQLSAQVGQNISTLQRRLYVILHTSRGGDRRAELRTAVAVKFRAQFGAVNCSGYTGDISTGGALLVTAEPVKGKPTDGFIELEGIGRIGATVVAVLETGLRVRFEVDRSRPGHRPDRSRGRSFRGRQALAGHGRKCCRRCRHGAQRRDRGRNHQPQRSVRPPLRSDRRHRSRTNADQAH